MSGQIRSSKSSKTSSSLASLARIPFSLPNLERSGSLSGQNPVLGSLAKYIHVEDSLVLVQAFAQTDAVGLREDLKRLGMERCAILNNAITGWLPLSAISKLGALDDLAFAKPVYKPIRRRVPGSFDTSDSNPVARIGSLSTQGDVAQRSDEARLKFNVDGSGVKVGVLSDSFNYLNRYKNDIISGDLPGNVDILVDSEGFDEGRAMLQIVHDIAPGASLAFRTAFLGPVDFAKGILELAEIGARVIVDDIGYFSEPFFQDGVIAQAVTSVTSSGRVSYFSAAGNDGRNSYQSEFRPSVITGDYQWHDFSSGIDIDTFQDITLEEGDEFTVSIQWDQPFASAGGRGSESDVDIFILSMPILDNDFIVAIGDDDNVGGDAVEIISFKPAVSGTYYVAIGQYLPGGGPSPSLIKYINLVDSVDIEYATNSSTSFGHPIAAGGLGVAAIDYRFTPAFGVNRLLPQPFTSLGGTPILFDAEGNRLPQPEVRQQPAIAAPDGVSTTVPAFNPFLGTSAAAPSAAAAAALLLDAEPRASNADIYEALQSTALDVSPYGFDFLTGFGFIQVDQAIEFLSSGQAAPGLPSVISLSVSPSAVKEDGSEDLVFTFSRSGGDLSQALVIDFTIGGTAATTDFVIIGEDSRDPPRFVTFAPGLDSVDVVIRPIADLSKESDETIIFTINAQSEYMVSADDRAIGLILNDDTGVPTSGRPAPPPGRSSVPGRSRRSGTSDRGLNAFLRAVQSDFDLISYSLGSEDVTPMANPFANSPVLRPQLLSNGLTDNPVLDFIRDFTLIPHGLI